KGQQKIQDANEVDVSTLGGRKGVLEKWIEFEGELSVICARGADCQLSAFPTAENVHHRHILDQSIVPARLPAELQREATEIAKSLATVLEVVGLLGVAFFFISIGNV